MSKKDSHLSMKPIDPEFGKRIRAERIAHNMTVRELATKIGCSPAQLTRLELANRNVTNVKWVQGLSKALNIPYDELAKLAGAQFQLEGESLLRKAIPSIQNTLQEETISDFASIITSAVLSSEQTTQLLLQVKALVAYFLSQS